SMKGSIPGNGDFISRTSVKRHEPPRRPPVEGAQTPRSTTQVLLPPNPNEFDTATRTLASRAECGTWQRSHSGSGSSRLIVGGTAPLLMAARQASASAAAAAVSRWPVMLLVELTGTRRAWSPSTAFSTRDSDTSPTGVLVAWALT